MLQNNSESMQTVVETFLVEETINLIHDGEALQKWNDKVSELGLDGQKCVVAQEKSPIPFMWMNAALISTFETLCPTKVIISKYNKTPIPVELLELVSMCIKENYFDGIKVWYNEKQKDPVIVGYKMKEGKKFGDDWDSEYTSYTERYLIGRWADVKSSIDELVKRAKNIFFRAETIRLKQEIRDRQRNLEDLETNIENIFGGAMPTTDLPF